MREWVCTSSAEYTLDTTGITLEQLRREGADLKTVANEVIAFAVRNTLTKGPQYKPVLIGQNIPFDIGFLQQMMAYAGLMTQFAQAFAGTVDFYGNFQPRYIDTLDLGHMAFARDPSVGPTNSNSLPSGWEWNSQMPTMPMPTLRPHVR